jgi:hypothetical protein
MKDRKLSPALESDAIFGKSKAYINKAISRKDGGDLDEYQLWASLALELLGKASLSAIHPSLIVDPTHYESLFAASGVNISADIKTITAKTLYERLRHIIPRFDESVKKFCLAISLRRNSELHSGETPFRSMNLEAWESQFWHACQIILESMDASLDDWLGAKQAKAPRAIIKHAQSAKKQAVTVRISRTKENFEEKKKRIRERALEDAEQRQSFHYRDLFTLVADHTWSCRCPSCGGKAYLAGIKTDEEIVDTYGDEDGGWEQVETHYSAEQFRCPVCNLYLEDSDEIEYSGLDATHTETEEREMEYEEEYGNE